ncbi:MAG: PadR family transcriptional regulator [Anaerolineae bacterium]|nr:PadR family transcriptional regulator [Anaerolineae bacterium]
MTGYEIKKKVGTALQAITRTSYGTLYPTLHRLLSEGAVEVEDQPQSHRPTRKVYAITPRGRQELQDWLRQPAAADQERSEFLLKLFFARDLPQESLKRLCLQRRAETAATLAALQQYQGGLNGSTPCTQVWVHEYTVVRCEAELTWLDRLIAQIEAGPASTVHRSGQITSSNKAG